jgi:hypothetical protein
MRTFARRRTQVVREQSAKLRCGGSNPPGASNSPPFLSSPQETEPVEILCVAGVVCQAWSRSNDRSVARAVLCLR